MAISQRVRDRIMTGGYLSRSQGFEARIIEPSVSWPRAPNSSVSSREPSSSARLVSRKTAMEGISSGARGREVLASRRHVFATRTCRVSWCRNDKVLNWIRDGSLRAINVASSESQRPRYRIEASAIESFRQRKAVHTPVNAPRLRPRPPRPDVTEYF